jgi:periplasmic protein TonB
VSRSGSSGAVLWSSSFAVMLAAHVGLAALVLGREEPPLDGQPGDAVSIELSPDPSDEATPADELAGKEADDAPSPSESPDASDPEPPAPDAPPPAVADEIRPELPPELTAPPTIVPDAEVVLPPTPDKPPEIPPPELKPLEEPPPVPPPDAMLRDLKPRDTAESAARAPSAAAVSGGRRPTAAAEATWRGAIGLHLARNRRYPAEARARGLQGTATVRVTIDGEGRVLGRELARSSGQPLLDREALEMMLRAQPLPRPPAGMPVPQILSVPVRFSIR